MGRSTQDGGKERDEVTQRNRSVLLSGWAVDLTDWGWAHDDNHLSNSPLEWGAGGIGWGDTKSEAIARGSSTNCEHDFDVDVSVTTSKRSGEDWTVTVADSERNLGPSADKVDGESKSDRLGAGGWDELVAKETTRCETTKSWDTLNGLNTHLASRVARGATALGGTSL